MKAAGLAVLLVLAPQAGPYDGDAKHPWNELHRALFTWRPTRPEKTVSEGYEADPLFWPLGAAPWTFSEAVSKALVRFDEAAAETDPLKRALLQHDVWMFLDGLEGQPLGEARSLPPETEESRAEIRRRLVPLLRRLALTPEELRGLPDTYAAAAKSGRHAAAFDPQEPERSFLPADLWNAEGPWVLLGREDGKPAAPQHVKHFRGRSVFLVFLSLPGGREATLRYVRELGACRHVKNAPRPPAGTRLALVRRAFLLDAKGRPQLSALTEEVRIRATLSKTRAAPAGLFEFHLNRGDLLAGTAGGLRASGPTDEAVLVFFHHMPSKEAVRKSCLECHGQEGIPSSALQMVDQDLRTHEGFFDGIPMKSSSVQAEAEAAVTWKRADASWTKLMECWPKD